MSSTSHIYRIHHKCLSQNHKFEIDNGIGDILYIVRSNLFSLFNGMSLLEKASGKELIKIRVENVHLHIRYDLSLVNSKDNNEQHLATVKRIHDQHQKQHTFEISSIYGVYQVEHAAGLFNHEFKLTTGNKTVVNVTKNLHYSNEKNLYDVEISADDGGDLFLLAIVIALWSAQRWYHIS